MRNQYSAAYLEEIFSPNPQAVPETNLCSLPATRPLPFCPSGLSGLFGRVLLRLTGGQGRADYQRDCIYSAMRGIGLSLPRFSRAKSIGRALGVWATDQKIRNRIMLARFRMRLWSLPGACFAEPPASPQGDWFGTRPIDVSELLCEASAASPQARSFHSQVSLQELNQPVTGSNPKNKEEK